MLLKKVVDFRIAQKNGAGYVLFKLQNEDGSQTGWIGWQYVPPEQLGSLYSILSSNNAYYDTQTQVFTTGPHLEQLLNSIKEPLALNPEGIHSPIDATSTTKGGKGKKLLLFLLISILGISCATPTTILRNNEIYSYNVGNSPSGPTPACKKYKVVKSKQVTIVDNGTYLVIKDKPGSDNVHYSQIDQPININGPTAVWKDQNMDIGYFTEDADVLSKKRFWYRDGKIVLQTGSVPLKIRPAIKEHSIPSQTETGFNIGFLSGYKFSWYRHKPYKNVFGQNTDKFSISPCLLFTTGAADLSTNTTRPQTTTPRKAAMISVGEALVFGFNNINIGYAFGWDNATGASAPSWIYKGKMWHGIILSLDLIK